MRKGTVAISLVAMLLCMCTLAFAGDDDSKMAAPNYEHHPPNYLNIQVEMTKPGVGPAHEKLETGWPQAFAKANWPTHYLAMTSVTGKTEAWFITGYDSAEAAEKDGDAFAHNTSLRTASEQLAQQDAQYLTGTKMITAMFKPDMSYSGAPFNIAENRYFRIITIRVKPGHDEEFKEMFGMIKAAHEKAKLNENLIVFQVAAGVPGPTYLVFVPIKSMKAADEYDSMHSKMYQDTMDADGRKKIAELTSACEEGSETNYFEFSPKMSYVPKEWIAANPDFWAPKTIMATKTKKAPDTKAKKEGAQ
jgi:hypothetical protein